MTFPDMLTWLYLANAVVLILHEIDSAYWKEWELFRLPGGIAGFLALHVPLLFVVLYGMVMVGRQSPSGLIYSLILGSGGLFAFVIHLLFMARGGKEFRTPASLAILGAAFILSLIQIAVTVMIWRSHA
jgi:hypothetical protein